MRRLFILLAVASVAAPVAAQVHVHGYMRSNGTYVAPYTRTAPDSSIYNNYSTRPNINPYTGREGTVNPYGSGPVYSSPSPSYNYSPAPVAPTEGDEGSAEPQ